MLEPRVFKSGNRTGELIASISTAAQVHKANAEERLNFALRGLKLEGCFEILGSLAPVAGRHCDHSEVCPRIDVVWIELKDVLVRLRGNIRLVGSQRLLRFPHVTGNRLRIGARGS